MRDMLRCRRGSVALATVIALVPLIGVVALGAEAASWYVTKQRAQDAADAAAYSGALLLECTTVAQGGGPSCADTQTADYRARQFAAQNSFCDGTDTNSYPGSRCPASFPSGTSRAVSIVVGTNQVQATVSQTQPAYLAKLFGLSTVTIPATAIAEVDNLALPCVLSLTDPLAFQGNASIQTKNNCGMSSNDTDPSTSVQFTGNSVDISQVASISGVGGCSQTGGTQCSKVITSAAATPDPLSGLATAISALTTASFTGGTKGVCTTSPTAYVAGTSPCYNSGWTAPKGTTTLSGVYFIDGPVTISSSNVIVKGTATLILLPKTTGKNGFSGGSLTINGGPTIQLTGLATVAATQVPAVLGTTATLNLLKGLVIYDPETTSKNQSVNISGSSTTFFSGVTYAPNADVTYQGNTQSTGCNEVIAKGITLSGSSTFNNTSCPAPNGGAITHYVRLVQ